MFGVPGGKSNKTIIDNSILFNQVINGMLSPTRSNKSIQGTPLKSLYYLIDGIYPKYLFFTLPFDKAHDSKNEGVRQAPKQC